MESLEAHMPKALEILAKVPLIDGHNDWPHFIRAFYGNRLDHRFEPEKDLAGHVDVKRLLKGRSGGVFWSAYVDCPSPADDLSDEAHFETIRDTLQQIDLIHRLVERHENTLAIAYSSSEIMSIFKHGKIASLIGVEGLHQIGNSSSVLRMYHKLGVRYVTLAHNQNNLYADSATAKAPLHRGLSSAGKDMVREMNRIGMLIDLSHVSEPAMLDALSLSAAPVAFTHSSASSIVQSQRNVSDICLKGLQKNNGIIMVSLIPQLSHSSATSADLYHVVDHIIYVAHKIGYDHIGLGSDFDGMIKAVKGVEDVARYPNLVAAMLSKGIEEQNIEKIIGLNIIRVLSEVEMTSTKVKSSPVLEDDVKQLWKEDFRAFVRSEYPDAEHDHMN